MGERTAQPVSIEKRKAAEGRSTMRAIVVKAEAPPNGRSRAIEDPWSHIEGGAVPGVLSPPFDPTGLILLKESSTELGSNIDVMKTNVAGFGHRLKRLKHTTPAEGQPENPMFEAEVASEFARIDSFLDYVDYDEKSLENLRSRWRDDMETTGNAYFEVIRDLGGRPVNWRLLPSFTMRLTKKHPDPVAIRELRPRRRGQNSGFQVVSKHRKFRKFAQARFTGAGSFSISAHTNVRGREEDPNIVWFKEYGDPRTMDRRTGQFVDNPRDLDPNERATEVVHLKIESQRSPYGIVRWIGALVPILGVRSAEEINFATFKNNNIPSMAVLVSGGQLTDGTISRIQEFVEEAIQGDDNYSKFIILEAETLGESEFDDPSNIKMDIKPLTKEQHADGLFTTYDEKSRKKIRQGFRIPPILVGASEDFTRSTAETARKVADEQVFNPERLEEDHLINRFLVQEFQMLHHHFATNTPNVTNDQDLVRVLTNAEKTGGMTPRIANQVLSDILGQDLPLAQGVDVDVPFSLTMAEAVKNMAQPNEPGQQVTALKATVQDRVRQALEAGHTPEDILEALFDMGAQVDLEPNEVLGLLGVEIDG